MKLPRDGILNDVVDHAGLSKEQLLHALFD